MNFYQLMSARYANRRTFSPESEGAAGGSTEAGADEGAGAAAGESDPGAADTAGGAGADAGQGGADVKADAALSDAAGKADTKTDAEKAALLREVMEKKAKLKEADERLKSFEGVDVAKYRELLAKEQEAERAAAEAKGDFERVKEMMAQAHQSEKADLETTLTSLKQALADKDAVINELTIGNDFGNSAFIQKEMILTPAKTRVLYGAYFEVEDGKTVGYDKPRGDATRTKLVDSSGKVLAFNEALAKIVNADPEKKTVLRSNAQPGAGSSTADSKAAKAKPADNGLYGAARILASLEKGK